MLVRRLGVGEQVKVVDFGIAKVLNSTAGSMVSRSIGTPAYASPEQWKQGAQIDGRADIYALGVMLFEMLTGNLPFKAQSVEELIRLKLTAPPPSLHFLLPDAPAVLDDLLRRMMDIAPNRRPQKVSEVPVLFEAACKPFVDLLQASTLAEATEKMRESEIRRIEGQPSKQPDEPPLLQQPQRDLTEEEKCRASLALVPAPEEKRVDLIEPKSEIAKDQPVSPAPTARFSSAEARVGAIGATVKFILRGLNSLAVIYFVALLLWLLWSLGQGEESYYYFMAWMGWSLPIVFNVIAFLFVLYHSITWVNFAPKAMPVRLGGKRLPDWVIAVPIYAAWVVISAIIAWFILGDY
jgi:serine/threonine protein kinase